MMRRFKKFRIIGTDLLLLALLAYTLFQVPLTVYGLGQGRGQLLILWNAKPIKELQNENIFTPAEKENLDLIQDVKEYSVDSLNYEPSENYNNYYDQHGHSLLWIVTACQPYELEDYKWKFPYLGEVSYKGYFDSLKAVTERNRLWKEGWDTDISRVSAWSTLGFFHDPVFSDMLKKHKGELAELMFHELFHGTIYAESSVDLNENLANFISRKATMQYLKNDSAELNLYLKDLEEDKEYDRFVFSCIHRLDSLYSAFKKGNLPEKERSEIKSKLIFGFCMELNSKMILNEKKLEKTRLRLFTSGNSYFMHFKRYDGLADSLENIFQQKYQGQLKEMIKGMKAEIKSL